MNMITHKELTSSLNYNPETGVFTWKIASGSSSIGKVAGFKTNSQADYLSIRINGKSYLCHRLAWFYMKGCWPKGLIDHINGVKNDNRISNLREVTRGQNKTNSVSSSNTGIKGVHL
ncbi:HNH endonuclease, partial [Escherichia coli]|nr:HNH endonuclease [Escherichia coli]